MLKVRAYNDVMFEDVSDDVLMFEDSLVVLEPYGSFPVCNLSKPVNDSMKKRLQGGEI